MMVLPSRAGDLLSQDLLRLIPVTFPRRHPGQKKQETANDLLPVEGSDNEEASGSVPSSFGEQLIPQMRKSFPYKSTVSVIFFRILNLCLC